MGPTGRSALFTQLKRDLAHGRLSCSGGECAALGALIVQDELGDFNAATHVGDYVTRIRFSARQCDTLEKRVKELHAAREPGQDAQACRDEFVRLASGLDAYGVDPHPVKDHRGSQLYLGVNHTGIGTFSAGKRVQHFKWSEVHKLNYEAKMFIAHLTYTDKKHTVGFKCPTGAACRHLWRCAIEQMLFFTLPSSSSSTSTISGGGFLSWGSRFKYSGMTQREMLQALRHSERRDGSRDSDKTLDDENGGTKEGTRKASSVPATPSSPQTDLGNIRYSSLPRSALSAPVTSTLDAAGASLETGGGPLLLETVSEEQLALHRRGLQEMHTASDSFPGDFYIRDSIENHSSSESEPIIRHNNEPAIYKVSHESMSHPQMTQTSTTLVTSILNNHEQQTVLTPSNDQMRRGKKFHLLRVFVPSFVSVLLIFFISAIVLFETETDTLSSMRNIPEMLVLRHQYYQPVRNWILDMCGGTKKVVNNNKPTL